MAELRARHPTSPPEMNPAQNNQPFQNFIQPGQNYPYIQQNHMPPAQNYNSQQFVGPSQSQNQGPFGLQVGTNTCLEQPFV